MAGKLIQSEPDNMSYPVLICSEQKVDVELQAIESALALPVSDKADLPERQIEQKISDDLPVNRVNISQTQSQNLIVPDGLTQSKMMEVLKSVRLGEQLAELNQAMVSEHDSQAEEIDYEWALSLEQKIYDFIVTHELSNDVDIRQIACRSTLCEISVYEYAPQI